MSEIVTKKELEEYLGESFTPTSKQEKVRLSVNAWIDKYCSRDFRPQAYSEKHTIRDCFRTKLFVKNPPIRSLAIYSGRTSPTLVDSDAYVISDADHGIIEFVSMFLTPGVHQYRTDYDGGFETWPDDLKETLMSIMARGIKNTERVGIRGRSYAGGSIEFGGGEQFVKDLEGMEKRVLTNYVSVWMEV